MWLIVFSFKNNQNQNGISAISIKKNKITSTAIKCLVENTKQKLIKPDITPLNKKHKKRSLIDISNDPIF